MTDQDADDMRMNLHTWLDDPAHEEVRDTRTIDEIRQACAERRQEQRICACTIDNCCRTV